MTKPHAQGNRLRASSPSAPYYICTYSGFLVVENHPDNPRGYVFTTLDVGQATMFRDFMHADAAAKWAVGRLFPRDVTYFALFATVHLDLDLDHHQPPPYYVATNSGLLVIEAVDGGRERVFPVPDAREATPFDTVDEAQLAAISATEFMYPANRRHYTVLAVAHA